MTSIDLYNTAGHNGWCKTRAGNFKQLDTTGCTTSKGASDTKVNESKGQK